MVWWSIIIAPSGCGLFQIVYHFSTVIIDIYIPCGVTDNCASGSLGSPANGEIWYHGRGPLNLILGVPWGKWSFLDGAFDIRVFPSGEIWYHGSGSLNLTVGVPWGKWWPLYDAADITPWAGVILMSSFSEVTTNMVSWIIWQWG